ncbi:MAG: S-layer homology domain-containing protein [Oscillospiraceae bacterium]|nr:S-layer homology domain-containing protein [Oscillospiraceae bacterium]
MKKRFLSLALALALVLALVPAVTASDTVITFPDANFEAAVRELIGKPTGDILTSDVSEITWLSVDGREIEDLTGIEYFTALTYLWVDNNQLTTLDLRQNTALTDLQAVNNQLTTLDLSNNTVLTWLEVRRNQLTTLDLSNNTVLTWLEVRRNQLTTLDLSRNTALTGLNVSNNQLTALDVSQNTALTDLSVGNNQLTTLDVSQNTALTRLIAVDNQLTTLDISRNSALTELWVTDTQLTTLDISNNTALTYLDACRNQLTALDVSRNTELAWLYVQYNQLTTLDVSRNTALIWLRVDDNQLTTLDVSNNTELRLLWVYGNLMGQDPAVSVPAWTKSPALNAETYDDEWEDFMFFYFPQGDGTPSDPLDSADTWAKDGITEAIAKGFVPSDIQGSYTQTITRAEFCRMAVSWVEFVLEKDIDAILAERDLARDPDAFGDTSDSYILAAYALDITGGVGGGLFNPDGGFTREQAAVMIMNTCRAIGADVSDPPTADFTDLDTASNWARNGINFVRANGIMSGTSTTEAIFTPSQDFNRQQSIVTFNNIKVEELP